MTILDIRFRVAINDLVEPNQKLVVLQVFEYAAPKSAYYGSGGNGAWRDAAVEDLLTVAKFTAGADSLRAQVEQLSRDVQSLREQSERESLE